MRVQQSQTIEITAVYGTAVGTRKQTTVAKSRLIKVRTRIESNYSEICMYSRNIGEL